MRYEEKIIGGILHFRYDRTQKWSIMTKVKLATRISELEARIADLEGRMNRIDDPLGIKRGIGYD